MTTLQTPYCITAVLLHVYQVGAAVPPGLAQLHVTSSDPLPCSAVFLTGSGAWLTTVRTQGTGAADIRTV